ALRAMGVVDYITKPFSPEAVLAVVSYSLEKHGQAQRDETTRITTSIGQLPTNPSASFDSSAIEEPDLDDRSIDDRLLAGAPMQSGEALEPSSEGTRELADALLDEVGGALALALETRGVDRAGEIARGVCDDVRARLSSSMLAEIVKRAIGLPDSRHATP